MLLGYVFLMVSTVFGYTVIDHEYYKDVANRQQKKIEKNPVSR